MSHEELSGSGDGSVPGPASRLSPALDPDPDRAEQALADENGDSAIPSRGERSLPMVGIGGSAGGIQALLSYFRAMPPDSGMAFVVILHLPPDEESALAAVLQRATPMPVFQVVESVRVLPNQVYVIPPARSLVSMDGWLRLAELPSERGRRVAVDLFFRTLADTHGPHATAIVLSGMDSDGAIGIKRIKERGGLTIAQDPDEAEHSGMPRAAIATGMVDWVLRTSEMPLRLMTYAALEGRLRLPSGDGPQPTASLRAPGKDGEAELRDVLAFLRARTGRDFSYYKRATILRRISRRMQVNGIEELSGYLLYLRTHPGEAGALLQDLLISVTNFFRDREAFEALEQRIPELFEGKGPTDAVRVWVAACATGEEAYSIAMLLTEHARKLDLPPLIQVFATDLDDEAIQTARDGIYPETIAADVSEERLRRFFVKEHGGYRVRREVRETVLFALHDLLKDSPFSRLDMVSCRNLLIYLNRPAQERVFEIFHFALRPAGRLFLGSSESVEDGSTVFAPLDKKHRIYAPRAAGRMALPVPYGVSTLAMALDTQERARARQSPGLALGHTLEPHAMPTGATREGRGLSWSELHFRLVEHLAPPSILINEHHEILHLSENAGRFLQFASGAPTLDLLRTVLPSLRIELRAALYRSAQAGQAAEATQVPAEINGEQHLVNIRVNPVPELAPDFTLVIFDAHASPLRRLPAAPLETEPVVRQLESELEELKSHLRDVMEQGEASTEELKASNEELQAMNEELRSATEELETSREELQSINEELTTVNQELKSKVDELGHANSDLHNLMAATAIATVFLDRSLCIMRYTPSAVGLFSLIRTDIGRPLADLRRRFDYPELESDAERALTQLLPSEREVQADDGWFIVRTLPYRTTDDHIAGVVLTFVDITERKKAESDLLDSRNELEQRVAKRTAELGKLNGALKLEVIERGAAEGRARQLLDQLVNAAEEERRRLSRELHDSLGQHLAAIAMELEFLERHDRFKPDVQEHIARLRAGMQRLDEDLDRLSYELHPVMLDDLGLEEAVRVHAQNWSRDSQVELDIHTAGLAGTRLPAHIEINVYRVVQEALTNVRKHAAANQVSVVLERRGAELRAIVEDHGKGFDTAQVPPSSSGSRLGLRSMAERAALLGGTLQVESTPGQGTTVYLTVPLDTDPPAPAPAPGG